VGWLETLSRVFCAVASKPFDEARQRETGVHHRRATRLLAISLIWLGSPRERPHWHCSSSSASSTLPPLLLLRRVC
jgi:hypothetical protein